MRFEHYQAFVKSGLNLSTHGDTYRERLILAAMGLSGEAGEVCDHAKKFAFHHTPMDRDALLLEMGDVLWYYALMLSTNDITLDEVMEANVRKLCERYPDKHGTPEKVIAERAV